MMRDTDNDPEFRRGLAAQANGVELEANPHVGDSYEFELWSMGWQTARARTEAVAGSKAHTALASAVP